MVFKDISFCNYPENLLKNCSLLICLCVLIVHGVRVADILAGQHRLPNFHSFHNLSRLLPVYRNGHLP